MSEGSEAYKLAVEAGREATKQLLVVTGGLLAGYLAFMGRPETANILDIAWARSVLTQLFASLFLGSFSLAFSYLMHAARSRFLDGNKARDRRAEKIWEGCSIAATLVAFGLLLSAISTIVITAYC